MLNTPFGNPDSYKKSAILSIDTGDNSDGLSITEFPAANAQESFFIEINKG